MKILVVRFSSIGDIVLTFPVLRGIKEQLPNVELHFLTKASYKELITASKHIDKVHLLNGKLDELIPSLNAEHFDVIIDLHNNLRTRILSFKLGIKCYRFPKLNFQKWLLSQLKIDRLPKVHIVERYFEAVKKIGVTKDFKNNQIAIPEQHQLSILKEFGFEEKTYLAVAIGAQFATKRMPESKLIEILEKVNLPIVLLGGKEDVKQAQILCQKLKHKSIKNACGNYSILQSASIVSQAKVVLSNDTGLMHIAACFSVPIISVWGNTIPELGMYPYKPEKEVKCTTFEVANLSCRPCSKIGYQSCPKKHFYCMMKQDTKSIARE
ncbi:MAG: glycosyltransferase family 9 protein, partial [Crocinitomicaceae bacterium]|nr:glycosyltransferase family 9 protein [Crocinitomicaceae bacterium]